MVSKRGIQLLPEPGDPNAMYVLDLSGFIWRFLKAPGQAPYAAIGFTKLIRRILRDQRPAALAVAADNPFPTFRHRLFAANAALLGADGYKEKREAAHDPVERARGLEQCRTAQDMLEDFYGIQCITARGFEADDVVATLAQQGLDAGMRVVLICHDKDMLQLVTTDSDRCIAWDAKYKVTDAIGVEEKFGKGVFPDRVTDYLAVVGDATDGIKGIVGCGEVAAQKIVNTFPSLEVAIEEAERGDQHPFYKKEPKIWAKVVHQQREARLCKELVTLVRDIPLDVTVDQIVAATAVAVETALSEAADREDQDRAAEADVEEA